MGRNMLHLQFRQFDDVPLKELRRMANEQNIIIHVSVGSWVFWRMGQPDRRSPPYRSARACLIASLTEDIAMLHKCRKCKRELSEDDFPRDATKKSGRESQCKACKANYVRSAKCKNQPAKRKRWADSMIKHLDLNPNDY